MCAQCCGRGLELGRLCVCEIRFDASDVLPSISLQVSGGYHIWCVGSMVPKWTKTSYHWRERLCLVIATCQQLKDACTTGAHSPGKSCSTMINLTMVPILSRKTLLPSELAGVIHEVTDLIRPQVNMIRVFTFDRLSWQLGQLLDHGFLYIVAEQDTPEGQSHTAFTMPQKGAVQRIQDLLACKEVRYAHACA